MRKPLPKGANRRFWAFINDAPVKITLKPDQTLSWYKSWPHDEGWSSEACQWQWDEAGVLRNWCNDGCDCDGRLTHTGVDFCFTGGLDQGPKYGSYKWVEGKGNVFTPDPDPEGIRWPAWEKEVPVRVYDEYAQAAGY